ncbi:MAG: TIGR00725 family protein [Chloroflexi bacterium]|nr:TIGR00725 family protein [Chloroflexota bacterium]
MPFIGVVGGQDCSPEASLAAEAVGRALACRGAAVVCGGLGGVMEAACKGARAEGGLTIGILPGDDASEANPYVQIPIVTGLGFARNVIVVRSSQAIIAVDGSYGTLSEIAYALAFGIPVVGLHTWLPTLDGEPVDTIVQAENPEDAAEKALALAKSRRPRTTGET